MLDKKMENALNEQVNAELWSAYLYLSMSAYFENKGMSGFANWMKIQFDEEQAHALKIFNYIVERGGKVVLKPISEVKTEWDSVIHVFEETLAHEQHVTSLINQLTDLAIELKDHATRSFLQWFVDEQVEEEATVNEILDQMNMFEGKGFGLFQMDKEFKTRTFTPIAE